MHRQPVALTVFLGCLAAAGALPADAGTQGSRTAQVRDDLATRLLAAHNRERAAMRVAALQWDAQLASSAAAYAPRLAALGRLEHSARSTRPAQSENLWMGLAGRYSPEQMVANWASERRWFRPGIFPNVSSTGNWFDVSHYSQIIWPTTTRVGCALHRDRRHDYLVCRYSPKGNQDGRRVP